MTARLRIDFVSDIACPWCVVGLRSLSRALEAVGTDVEAEIHFQPFELNPNMPPEGQNTTEHVKEKYGASPEQSARSRQAIKDSGAALGFTFTYGPESRIWNTFDAHRLLHWAGIEGLQRQMKEALFTLNFTEQKSTSDHEALAQAAERAGLDGARARAILKSGAFTDEVRHEEEVWRNRGINAVPAIIFNQRMIQGGQPPPVFEQAIRQIISGTAQEERALG
jgi:predicted DsbA family dithiol-disulfide isomerase